MTANTDIADGIPVIRPNGPLDRRVAAIVRYALSSLASRGMTMVAVDLSDAGDADEHGIELLAELSGRILAEGWRWMVISLCDGPTPAAGLSFRIDDARGRAFALDSITGPIPGSSVAIANG